MIEQNLAIATKNCAKNRAMETLNIAGKSRRAQCGSTVIRLLARSAGLAPNHK